MIHFEWDLDKEMTNIQKHGIDFRTARRAFLDPHRLIYADEKHSGDEARFFCVGKVEGQILTVRFSYREETVRIFGAGYWRKGKRYYGKEKEGK